MAQDTTAPASLKDAAIDATKVLVFYGIPDRSSQLPRLLPGGRACSEDVAIAGLVLICPAIALVLLLLTAVGSGAHWNSTDWFVLYYIGLNLALFRVPRDTWRRAVAIAGDVDDLIGDPEDRARIAKLIARTSRLDVQLAFGACGFIAGLAGGAAAAHARGVGVMAAMPFELSIGFTLFLGADVVLWIVLGMLWLRSVSGLASVRFDAIDPLRSPGLSKMYDLLGRARWYATGGLVLALLPLVFLYNQTRDSSFLHTSVLIAGGGSALVVLLAYTLPPWYLHLVRVRDKDTLLGELRATMPRDLASLDHEQLRVLEPRLELYRRVQARSTGGLSRTLLASLIAALVSLAVAFVPLLIPK